jgi:lysyl-tRNA synthetase class I
MIALVILVVLVVLTITNRIAGKTYVAKVLYAFDLFACALITRENGLSISAQCGLYWRHDPPLFWDGLHVVLNAIQKDHCELAVAHELGAAKSRVILLS